MRGSPLIRALVAFLILLGLGWPLQRLLQADVAAPVASVVPAVSKAAKKEIVHMQVSFTSAPERMEVLALGKPVWQVEHPGTVLERDLPVAYPPEGIDLEFHLEWPAQTRAAAQVRLTDPAGEEHVKLLWSEGPASDVITFP